MGKITKKSFVTVSGEMQPYEYIRTIKLFDKKIFKTCVFYKRKIWSLKMTSIYSIKKCVEKLVSDFIFLFAGALSCSELLLEYGIKGPLDEDKLNLLREERLALVLAAEIEENEMLWTDYEYEETQTKLDVADMILEYLAEEAGKEMNRI